MTFDPSLPEFWDAADLKNEMTRIFDICHGCRLCDKLCPSFDHLFRRLDTEDDALTEQGSPGSPMDSLTAEDYRTVSDLCYQCKLCYPKCPYTPPHHYELDFPRLILREQAVHKRKSGISFNEKILADPDRIGKLGSRFPNVMNWANTNQTVRRIMETTTGIHHGKKLPQYHSETFEAWFIAWKAKRGTIGNPSAKVAIYATCLVNYNNPNIGKALVKVLDYNNVEIVSAQKVCCGMPNISTGDLDEAQRKADLNIETLFGLVEQGYDIVIPSPSCSLNIRQDYIALAKNKDKATQVHDHSFDACEYVMKLVGEGKVNLEFKFVGGEYAYHLPCHLKAQNIGFKSRDLLKLIPDTNVTMIQQCSGHDGQWSMKREYYELSLEAGKKLFHSIEKTGEAQVTSDCAFAHLHIAEATGQTSKHPIEIFYEAYGLQENE